MSSLKLSQLHFLETSNPESLLSLPTDFFSLSSKKKSSHLTGILGQGGLLVSWLWSLPVLCEGWVTSDGASVPGRRAERENVGGFLCSQSVRVYLTKFLHSTHKHSETDRWTDLPKVAELVSSLKLESDICPRHLYCMLVSNDNKDVNNNNNNNNIYWVLTVDPTLFHKRHTLIPLILTKTSWDRGYYYFYFSGRNRSSE